jgi:hypothetical protein
VLEVVLGLSKKVIDFSETSAVVAEVVLKPETLTPSATLPAIGVLPLSNLELIPVLPVKLPKERLTITRILLDAYLGVIEALNPVTSIKELLLAVNTSVFTPCTTCSTVPYG